MENHATRFNVHEAKTNLSRILELVEDGEEIVICRAGKPVAKVIPFPQPKRRSSFGSLKGKIEYAPDWDSDETNAAIAATFYESE